MTWCLYERADFDAVDAVVAQQQTDELGEARRYVAEQFGFSSWQHLHDAVERRMVLNARDLQTARERIQADPTWATSDLTGWCDHCLGAAPLNYMAMLRFDAPRLGLTGPLEGTGEMAQLLLDSGAPVNGNPGESETPLITAASYGDADVAKVLIAAGADLDALASPDAGGVASGSALLHAAVFGMTAVLDAVVAAGAQVRSFVEAAAAGDLTGWPIADANEEERLRALIMAADHQRLNVVDEILNAGTPIDGIDPIWGRQPLCVAAEHGRHEAVRHLLARGADPAAKDGEGRAPIDLCQGEHRYLPGPHHDEVLTLLTAALEAR